MTEHKPTTAEERTEWLKAGCTLNPYNTRRLTADIDRLVAERADLERRLRHETDYARGILPDIRKAHSALADCHTRGEIIAVIQAAFAERDDLRRELTASEAALIGERASESFVSLSGARAEEIRRQVCSGLLDGAFQLVRCKTVPGVLLADALIEGAEAVVKHLVALEQKIERQRGQLEQKDAELRLKADLAAATQRAEAAEAGAAAMRVALEAAKVRLLELHGTHHRMGGEYFTDNGEQVRAAAEALRANPAGAALLEERQRVGNILGVLMAEVEVGENVAGPTEAQAGYQAAMAKVVALLTVALQLDEPVPAPGGEQP